MVTACCRSEEHTSVLHSPLVRSIGSTAAQRVGAGRPLRHLVLPAGGEVEVPRRTRSDGHRLLQIGRAHVCPPLAARTIYREHSCAACRGRTASSTPGTPGWW